MKTAARKKQVEQQRRRRQLKRLASFAERYDAGDYVDRQEAMLDGLDDAWEPIRQKIISLAGERGEWAGYPLPVEHCQLTIEPRHPLYASLNGSTLGEKKSVDDSCEVVNAWTDKNGMQVFLFREDGGRVQHACLPKHESTRRAAMYLDTLGASQGWSVRAEFTAMERLKTLITPVAFRYYLLTGTFIESSKRSKVFYLFRKCRPTLAFNGVCGSDNTHLLAALCLHPIGYYAGTYGGSMVPTDDVIAHLVMMRGDERRYWSKCNQHNCRSAEAGV